MKTKTEQVILVKYNKKTKDIKCKCGGDVWTDGSGYYQTPIGIGDLGEIDPKLRGKFGITKVRYSGWVGQCEKCRKKVFAWETRKVVNTSLSCNQL